MPFNWMAALGLVDLGIRVFQAGAARRERKRQREYQRKAQISGARTVAREGGQFMREQRAALGASGFAVGEGSPATLQTETRRAIEDDVLASLGLLREDLAKRSAREKVREALGEEYSVMSESILRGHPSALADEWTKLQRTIEKSTRGYGRIVR